MRKSATSLTVVIFLLCLYGCKHKEMSCAVEPEYVCDELSLKCLDEILVTLDLSPTNCSVLYLPYNKSERTRVLIVRPLSIRTDEFSYVITIDYCTNLFWWSQQGGFGGGTRKHGPMPFSVR